MAAPFKTYDDLIALADRVLATSSRPAHLMDEPEVEMTLGELGELGDDLTKASRSFNRNTVQAVMDNIASRY